MAPAYYDCFEDILRMGHREYLIKGGRGSGKSSFAATVILRGLLADKSANCVAYRRVGNTLKDSVYAVFARTIAELGMEKLFTFKKSPLEIIYKPTDQRILFRGADDPLKSKSIALKRGYFKYLWFEEASEFRCIEDLRSIVQSVLRGADEGVMICTYNPPRSASSWINEYALTRRDDRLTLHTTYLEMPKAWLGKRFLKEAEALKLSNERAYLNEYLGQVTGTGGQVFDNLVIEKLDDEQLNALDRRYFGLDFGFAQDPDALTEWAYDKKRRELYAVGEHVSSHQSAETLCGIVKRAAGRHAVYCDSAEPRMLAELKSAGINAVAVRKGAGSREAGYRWLQTLRAIRIDPERTPEIAREFSEYEYPRDKLGRFISAYPDGNDHTLDSCRYALEREIGLRTATVRGDIY